MKKENIATEEVKKYIQTISDRKTEKEMKSFLKLTQMYLDVPEIAKIVVNRYPKLLEYFSKNIKNNYQVVELAVKRSGLSFSYASKELQQNKTLALLAVKDTPLYYKSLSTKLKKDEDIISQYLTGVFYNHPPFIKEIPASAYENNMEFTKSLLTRFHGRLLEYLPKKLKNDFNIVELAIKLNGENIQLVSKEFQNNHYLATLSINTSAMNYFLLSEKLKNDKSIIKKVLEKSGSFLINFEKTPWANDYEIVETAIKQDGLAIDYASPSLKKNIALNKLALLQNPQSVFKLNKDVLLEPEVLVSLFKVGLSGNLSSFLNFDKSIYKITRKEKINQIDLLLEKENQDFFKETYAQCMKDSLWDVRNIFGSNKDCFDLFFKHVTKETLIYLIKDDKSGYTDDGIKTETKIFLEKAFNEAILKKDLKHVTIDKKITKNRKLTY